MRMLDKIRHGQAPKPPIVLLYGPPGVGKTTWAASAWNPVFICTEDGLASVDAPSFPICQTYAEVLDCLNELLSEEHSFNTVVLDSLDHMEPMLHEYVCQKNKWENIESPGYGKGYITAKSEWENFHKLVRAVRDAREMAVIFLAHSEVKVFNSPMHEPFDRYQIKLTKYGAPLAMEGCDSILFVNYKMVVSKEAKAMVKAKAHGRGERVIYTEERPAFIAKGRYAGLPSELPFDRESGFQEFAQYLPYYQQGENENG